MQVEQHNEKYSSLNTEGPPASKRQRSSAAKPKASKAALREKKAIHRMCSERLIHEAWELLKDIPKPDNLQLVCDICGDLCGNVFEDPLDPNRIVVEIAGTTCIAFSRMGDNEYWSHKSAMAALVWMWSVRVSGPDIIIHVCTELFTELLMYSSAPLTCNLLGGGPMELKLFSLI